MHIAVISYKASESGSKIQKDLIFGTRGLKCKVLGPSRHGRDWLSLEARAFLESSYLILKRPSLREGLSGIGWKSLTRAFSNNRHVFHESSRLPDATDHPWQAGLAFDVPHPMLGVVSTISSALFRQRIRKLHPSMFSRSPGA